MAQCFYCSSEANVLSERVNASGDLKTLKLDCGHTVTVAVILSLSRFSTSELKSKLSYEKRLLKMRNIGKLARDGAEKYIVALEAELKDRRA
jgi:hypothetical protein